MPSAPKGHRYESPGHRPGFRYSHSTLGDGVAEAGEGFASRYELVRKKSLVARVSDCASDRWVE